MNILTSSQTTFIEHFGKSSLSEAFYLTGGTALSEFFFSTDIQRISIFSQTSQIRAVATHDQGGRNKRIERVLLKSSQKTHAIIESGAHIFMDNQQTLILPHCCPVN